MYSSTDPRQFIVMAQARARVVALFFDSNQPREHSHEYRQLTPYERVVNFAEIKSGLDKIEESGVGKIVETSREVVARFVKHMRKNFKDESFLNELLPLRGLPAIRSEFLRTLQQAYDFGAEEITKELNRGPSGKQFAALRVRPSQAIEAINSRATTFTTRLNEKAQSIIRTTIAAGLDNGDDIEELAEAVRERLEDYLVGVSGSPAGLEAVVRTNVTDAFNKGRIVAARVAGAYLIAWMYSAILDVRTTETCRTLDGTFIKDDDPRLDALTPPMHPNCRSVLVPISVGETIPDDRWLDEPKWRVFLDIVDPRFAPGAEKSFAFNPSQPRAPKGSRVGGQWVSGGFRALPVSWDNAPRIVGNPSLHVRNVTEAFGGSPPELRRVLAFLPAPREFNYVGVGVTGYRPDGDLNVAEVISNRDAKMGIPGGTFRHEYGHHVDRELRRELGDIFSPELLFSSDKNEVSAAIDEAVEELQGRFAQARMATRLRYYQRESMSSRESTWRDLFVDDLVGALTGNAMGGGHPAAYISSRRNRNAEVFANLFELYGRTDRAGWKFVQDNLPDLATSFERTVSRVIERAEISKPALTHAQHDYFNRHWIEQPRDPKGSPTGGQWTDVSTDDPEALEKLERELLDYTRSNWSLTEEETWALHHYVGIDYSSINKKLRANIDPVIPSIRDDLPGRIAAIDSAVDKSSIPRDLVVYRGMAVPAIEHFRNLKDPKDLVGKLVQDDGFISTSIRARTAASFGSAGTVVEIRLPKGSKGLYLDSYDRVASGERELLLPRRSRFRVVGYKRKKPAPGANNFVDYYVLEPVTRSAENTQRDYFNPNWEEQARDPKGTSTGGQWTEGGTPADAIEKELIAYTHENWELTDPELKALQEYVGISYSYINGKLRTGINTLGPKSRDKLPAWIDAIDSALAKSSVPKDVAVFRGLLSSATARFANLKSPNDLVGKIITDSGFISTSLDPLIAVGFAAAPSTGTVAGTVFELRVPKGSRGAYLGGYDFAKGEKELLLPRGSKFRVVQYKRTSFGGGAEKDHYVAELISLEPAESGADNSQREFFDPEQPRAPKGSPDGGQWVDGDLSKSGDVVQPEGVNSVDETYRRALQHKEAFEAELERLAQETGGKLVLPPKEGSYNGTGLKSLESFNRKLLNEEGGDVRQVTDVLRGSLVFDSVGKAQMGARTLLSKYGDAVLTVKDKFAHPTPEGYRDFLFKVRRPDGYVAEIQVAVKPILDVKFGEGHQIYERTRALIGSASASHRSLRPEELTQVAWLRSRAKMLYDAAFQQALRS